MKKILAFASLVFALSLSATAMAADASEVANGATVDYETDITGYETVLVQGPNGSADIVYVDQADNTFTSVVTLMLKEGIGDGEYTIKAAGAGLANRAATFTLTTADPAPADTFIMTKQVTTAYGDKNNIAYKATVNGPVNKVRFTCTVDGVQKTADLALNNVPSTSGIAADCVVLVQNVPNTITDLSVSLVNVTE